MKVELLVTSGVAKGKRFVFTKPDCFLFGRAADAHISLPNDLYVSRQHFFLEIAPPVCKLRDLNSKNGVIVNGVRYGGKTPLPKEFKQAPINETLLKDGDEISVGDTRIKVSIQLDTMDYQLAQQTPAAIRCARCGRDVTAEVRSLPQPPQGGYICAACRKAQTGSKPASESGAAQRRAPQEQQTPHESKPQTKSISIEGFVIEEKVGTGRMGEVYKARESKTGQLVAIKIFSPRVMVNPHKLKILQRELVIIRQLKHGHIVQFLGHGVAGNLLYFIFEFIDGITLKKFIQSHAGRVPLRELAPIILGTLEGLAYAHRVRLSARTNSGVIREWEGIIHRDLSPESILITQKGDSWLAKLTDFHLSKTFEEAGITDITTPEDILGQPMYWPREQLTHYKYLNPATDVFSIAAVFYEALTGTWVRDGFSQLLKKSKEQGYRPSISDYMGVIASHPVVPIRERDPQIPEPLARVIDRALREKEIPQETRNVQKELQTLRYPDAGVFKETIAKVLLDLNLVDASGRLAPQQSAENAQGKSPSNMIMLSNPQEGTTRDAALLLLDVAQSTQYVVNKGDTHFSTLIGNMLRRIRTHALSQSLFFLKGTGDGFLAAFSSMNDAFAVAETFLSSPIDTQIQLRLALHYGSVRVGVDGDLYGLEVHRISRIEGVGKTDRIESAARLSEFPDANRIMISTVGLEQLSEVHRTRFTLAGAFRLAGFEEPTTLWTMNASIK
ncbi:serine/threonine protein kinase with FHA domain [Candidatus Moduliflexus flocculans]|uniref:non-specific serine/threonine protein kinase n=1 Tax=Candidatus Moduliflexus flocculans TaxID=1499966 RepID=A0A0S6VX14_9BACT|nr:serine/threonine protein kinase with FHA domain [Candidatus Moduliflexus flocculans]